MLDPTVLPPVLREERLEAFVNTLVGLRKKAISGRQSSGIEDEWLEDEEFYQGVDDANRAFHRSWVASIKRGRPVTQEPGGSRSTVFLNITRPYVDAAAARVADMLLPVDDRCWDLKPTPIPDIPPELLAQLPQTVAEGVVDLAGQEMESAQKASDLMASEIDDLLVECNWHGEVRMMIEDAARIGTGVLKGPFPKQRAIKKYQMIDGMAVLIKSEDIRGASKRIDPWNFYPDSACGEDIHNGSGTWEREYFTGKQLRELLDGVDLEGKPLYRREALLECLKEGPQKRVATSDPSANDYVPIDDQYEGWIYYGVVDTDDMILAGGTPPDGADQTRGAGDWSGAKAENQTDVMAIMVNDRLIKITTNVMDTGEFPYDVMAWQRRPGVPWGMGVARHNRTPQRMLNAGARAMLDNAAEFATIQKVIGNGVTPADGSMDLRTAKTWRAEADVLDVRQAFHAWSPDSKTPQLMSIIEFALRMGEQTTGMPMLLQGQQGSSTDTLGGMQLLQNNASGVMRRLAKRFDDYITDKHIRRYYNWVMQYGTNPQAKGDFQVDVRASSALVERDSQKQFMYAMLNYAKDPAYGVNPYKLVAEVTKSERMDPKRIQFDEEDYKNRTSQQDPVAQSVAKLNEAKAKQATAAAAQTTVAGLYASTEAASLVATTPSIAPVADAIALSAGVIDANAAPLIPSPAPGTQPLAPGAAPANTHPNFPGLPPGAAPAGTQPDIPAQPASPVQGLHAGIEGGQP